MENEDPLPNYAHVDSQEELARFIFPKSWLRADKTVKADAFIPYSYVELSMTRHVGLREDQIWTTGKHVEGLRGRVLIGRADIQALPFRDENLDVVPKPMEKQPNHCDAINWPPDKESQKQRALEIAKKATFCPLPENVGLPFFVEVDQSAVVERMNKEPERPRSLWSRLIFRFRDLILKL